MKSPSRHECSIGRIMPAKGPASTELPSAEFNSNDNSLRRTHAAPCEALRCPSSKSRGEEQPRKADLAENRRGSWLRGQWAHSIRRSPSPNRKHSLAQ